MVNGQNFSVEYRSTSGVGGFSRWGCEGFIYDERGRAHGFVMSTGLLKWEVKLRTKIKARNHISWLKNVEKGVMTRVLREGSGWTGESRVELPGGGESVVTFDGLWRWSTALRLNRENRWHLRVLKKGGLL